MKQILAYQAEFIETVIVIIGFFTLRFAVDKLIKSVLEKFEFSYQREQMVRKTINFLMFSISVILITAIWGLEGSRLLVFITSIFTVIGIAFFAQWSILSNITSGLILFFNHPLKLGDYIKILDSDPIIEGRIVNITFFFMHIRTDEGDHLTIANSVVLQKMFSVAQKPTKETNAEIPQDSTD